MPKPPAGRPAGVPKPYRRANSRKWQIKVKVPKGAGGPRQIARSLETTDHAEALRRAPVVVAAIRREIERSRRNPDGTRKDLKGRPSDEQRALESWWAAQRVPSPTEVGRFIIPRELEAQWEADLSGVLGEPVNADRGRALPVYEPAREAAALRLSGLTFGTRTPVASELDRYLVQQGIRASYASRTRRAVGSLEKWLTGRPGGDDVNAVTGRAADQFADHVAETGVTTATVNSIVSALSAYWQWLVKRHIAAANPWAGQGRRVVSLALNAEKREFSDEEMVVLLSGPASSTLHDMMRLAALTGMRLTEIGGLKVKGIAQGLFHVEESKTRSGVRVVPVHPDLSSLVKRRTAGKSDTEFLIEELTSPPSHGGLRGKKIGEAFTAYRRSLGLDQRQSGRKQSDVDFHSFRRWFVTKAEQAGYNEVQVARVVGHKPPGFTFSTYSGGLADAQATAVVNSVRLPPDAPVEPPETPSGRRRKPQRPSTASTAAGRPR
ncbi:MAG: hypothetical protein EOO23_03225 [Comamonadaceae bacterium]|nr:MAG: hypothetical protein EOO23_03225 [Comamonadaceae bacterium]